MVYNQKLQTPVALVLNPSPVMAQVTRASIPPLGAPAGAAARYGTSCDLLRATGRRSTAPGKGHLAPLLLQTLGYGAVA